MGGQAQRQFLFSNIRAIADNQQEAVEKYQQSKRELDEVVAQMESLVSALYSVKTVLTTSKPCALLHPFQAASYLVYL